MRSVRADALLRQAHAFRIGSVLFILALLIAAHAGQQEVGAPGLRFFEYVSLLGAALITLAGMGHFATAITEEKEEGTLGLLLLADISPLAILLGKSTNRILSAWLIFVAQFPFALLSLTLGGITVGQISAAYLALAAYLFLVANLALLASVLCRRTGEATAAMTVLLILLHGAVPWLNFTTGQLIAAGRLAEGGPVPNVLAHLNAAYVHTSIYHEIGRIFEPAGSLNLINLHLLSCFLGGSMFFALAWLRFRRIVWAPDASQPPRGTVPSASSRWIALVPRPWRNPLIWKDFHFLAGGPVLVLAKLVLFPIYFGICLYFTGWIESATAMTVERFIRDSLLVVLIVELLVYSSQLFHVEQKWGTLPTLMMLPQSVAEIAYSKTLGCLLASVPTLVAYVVSVRMEGTIWTGSLLWVDWATLFAVCTFLALCQLTVLCSLVVNWGALPLAMGILVIAAALAFPVVAAAMALIQETHQAEYARLGPVLYVTGIVSAILQFEIARRIHLAAGR